MVNKNKKTTKNRIVPIIMIVLILTGAVFGMLRLTHTAPFTNTAKVGKEQEAAYDSSKKQAVVDGNGNPSTTNSKGDSEANTGTYTPPTTSDAITVSAVQQNTQVIVSTKLAGYSDGTCVLTVTNGGNTTSQTAKVIYAPEFSSCAGFSIPVTTLGGGTWNLSLGVTTGGTTLTKTTSLSVQ